MSDSSVKVDDVETLREQVRSYKKELDRVNVSFRKRIEEWNRLDGSARRSHFVGGLAVGFLAGTFAIAFVLCKLLPTTPDVIERTTGVTLAEYKHVVNSLTRCHEREREMREDMDQTDYTWERIMMLDHFMPDAPDDIDTMMANRICERCEDEAEQTLQDYKFDHDEFCWCPYDGEDWGPRDPWEGPVPEELRYKLDVVCSAMELDMDPHCAAWTIGCVGVEDRSVSDFDAYFPDYWNLETNECGKGTWR